MSKWTEASQIAVAKHEAIQAGYVLDEEDVRWGGVYNLEYVDPYVRLLWPHQYIKRAARGPVFEIKRCFTDDDDNPRL